MNLSLEVTAFGWESGVLVHERDVGERYTPAREGAECVPFPPGSASHEGSSRLRAELMLPFRTMGLD